MGAVDLIPFNGVQQTTSAPTLFNGRGFSTTLRHDVPEKQVTSVPATLSMPSALLSIFIFGMDSSIKISEGTQPRARRYLAPLRGYVATRFMLRGTQGSMVG
jgi:hypothetical protein